jgi:hypothetical protein
MALRFGEKISNQSAYDTARSATKDMSDNMLARTAQGPNGPNQQKAAEDEIAARKSK